MRNALSPDAARAVYAFLATGGSINVYPAGVRAYRVGTLDHHARNGGKPRVYCVHAPVASHRNA